MADRDRHRGMSVYCILSIGVWGEMRMGYIAREPIIRGIFAAQHTQGQAQLMSELVGKVFYGLSTDVLVVVFRLVIFGVSFIPLKSHSLRVRLTHLNKISLSHSWPHKSHSLIQFC